MIINPSIFIGENIGGVVGGRALYSNANGQVAQNSLYKWSDTYNRLDINALIGIASATTNLYVATTGNDANDGLTALTPKLTLDGANGVLSLIPTISGGIVQINTADGTYTRNSTNAYNLPQMMAVSGNTDYISVVRIVGNTSNPGNVIIQAASTNGSIFASFSKFTLYDFDGVTFDSGSIGIDVNGGYVILRNVDATNISGAGPYFQAQNFGRLNLTGWTRDCSYSINTASTISAIPLAMQRSGTVDFNPGTGRTLTINGVKNNSGISCGNFGRFVRASGNITINGDATVGGGIGLQLTSYGYATIGGVITIDKMNNASNSSRAAIRIFDNAILLVVGGSTLNLTNCTNGIFFSPRGALLEAAGSSTYVYTGTTTPVLMSQGATADSVNALSNGTVTYTGAANANPIFGYDDRYQKRADYANEFLLMGG